MQRLPIDATVTDSGRTPERRINSLDVRPNGMLFALIEVSNVVRHGTCADVVMTSSVVMTHGIDGMIRH